MWRQAEGEGGWGIAHVAEQGDKIIIEKQVHRLPAGSPLNAQDVGGSLIPSFINNPPSTSLFEVDHPFALHVPSSSPFFSQFLLKQSSIPSALMENPRANRHR